MSPTQASKQMFEKCVHSNVLMVYFEYIFDIKRCKAGPALLLITFEYQHGADTVRALNFAFRRSYIEKWFHGSSGDEYACSLTASRHPTHASTLTMSPFKR